MPDNTVFIHTSFIYAALTGDDHFVVCYHLYFSLSRRVGDTPGSSFIPFFISFINRYLTGDDQLMVLLVVELTSKSNQISPYASKWQIWWQLERWPPAPVWMCRGDSPQDSASLLHHCLSVQVSLLSPSRFGWAAAHKQHQLFGVWGRGFEIVWCSCKPYWHWVCHGLCSCPVHSYLDSILYFPFDFLMPNHNIYIHSLFFLY